MLRCEFSGNSDQPCPVPDDWPSVWCIKPCEQGGYGQNCAAIVGQTLVAETVDVEKGASSIDLAIGPITAIFKLQQVPTGTVPEDIRTAIDHQSFPLRERRPVRDGAVFVNHADLYLTLLNAEKLVEANWYHAYAKDKERVEKNFNWWCFEAVEGEIYELPQPVSTIERYDQSFMMGSATLWNCFGPALLHVRGRIRDSGITPVLGLS